MAVRIGNIDVKKHPLKPITVGKPCGEPGPKVANLLTVASFTCHSGLMGRFLVAQELSAIHFEAAEIDIFQACEIFNCNSQKN